MRTILPYLAVGGALFLTGYLRRTAGRLAPRLVATTWLFLVTRWPVALASVLGTATTFDWLWRDIVANGHEPAVAPVLAISLVCGPGVAVLVVGVPFFVHRALFVAAPVVPLAPDEVLEASWLGTHGLNGEHRGGVVLLTSRRLAFCPHRFNVQLDPWAVPRADLTGLTVEGSRFLLVAHRGAPEPDWLVVPDPAEVARAIDARLLPAA